MRVSSLIEMYGERSGIAELMVVQEWTAVLF